jgi:hypothetical protein
MPMYFCCYFVYISTEACFQISEQATIPNLEWKGLEPKKLRALDNSFVIPYKQNLVPSFLLASQELQQLNFFKKELQQLEIQDVSTLTSPRYT